MQIQVNNASNRAVYQQIVDHIKRDIALGRIKVGDKLPTVRDLARQLVLNPNTIARAYRELEQAGIIATRSGAGTFAAEMGSNLSVEAKKTALCDQIELVVVEAVHMRIDKKKLGEWFDETVEQFTFDSEKS